MRFIVGSDHAAVALREHLAARLVEQGHQVLASHGPSSTEDKADYPDVARKVCGELADTPDSFGLLVCGTGQGMAMTANHIPGIRAVVCSDVFSASMGRAHNDANVLCIGARVVGLGLADEILAAFCRTAFEGGRHQRRVDKIEAAVQS